MRSIRNEMVVGALALLAGTCLAAGDAANPSIRLLADAQEPRVDRATYLDDERADILRRRFVTIDDTLLVAPRSAVEPTVVTLNLFDNATFDVVFTGTQPGYQVDQILEGHLAGMEGTSWVTLVETDGIVHADILTVDAGTYEVRYGGAGVHYVQQVDRTRQLGCGSGPEHSIDARLEAQEMVDAARGGVGDDRGGDGDLIDVSIYYTVAARTAAGGTTGITNSMNAFVATTNNAYFNSNMVQRVRLVRLAETTYTQAPQGLGTDLDRLRANGDGKMDIVHSERNTFGADLVHLVVRDAIGACGIAYLMSPPSASFQSNAFGVTALGCGALTFAHELGHNEGCAHDHQNGSNGSYCYSFGYRTQPNGGLRTVMAYAPGSEIPYFSNPNISVNGVPIGISEAAGCSNGTAADNARSMNNTRFIVSGFRQQQVGNPPPTSFDLTTPADGAVGVNTTPFLQWEAADFVANYELRISEEADMSPTIYENLFITQTAFLVPPGVLENCTQYYWNVTAVGFGGETLSDSTYDFRTRLTGDIAGGPGGSGDGTVNFTDLNLLLSQYGQVGQLSADLDGDNDVDFADLNLMLSAYGLTCV